MFYHILIYRSRILNHLFNSDNIIYEMLFPHFSYKTRVLLFAYNIYAYTNISDLTKTLEFTENKTSSAYHCA